MLSEAPGASSRNYPGSRAFADPGTASSAGFLYNGVSPFGVCGTQQLGTNDYNYPGGNWGTTFTEVQAGEVLDVSWCVNADHGGVYQFRLCDKPELVAKLWADGPMSSEEQEELEQCYQDGILPCDSATNDCSFEIGCEESWGCAKEGLYFHCGDGVSTKACAVS